MKLAWKSLLITLSLLLPIPASIVLAEPASSPPAVENSSPSTAEETNSKPDEAIEPEQSPEEIARQQKLIEADRLYLAGDRSAAERLYREVKDTFAATAETKEKVQSIVDPAQLSPAGRVYWRESEAGLEQKLESRIFVPLQFLVDRYPEFIPGHLRLAQALKDYNRSEEALQVLERATTLYPDRADLLKAKIAAQVEAEQWLEASIAARQFALLNPEHAEASEFVRLADENLKRYKKHLQAEIRANAIAGAITGALTYGLTGSIFGPLSAVETAVLLLQGEETIGERVTKAAKRELDLIEDPDVVKYVDELGQKLAKVTGRTDFEYEFYVVLDEDINAFALPGGKVFVNAGAIIHSNSEAQLAGLLSHELSHAVLSHGFQLVTRGSVIGNVARVIPRGGILANLLILDYSRDMERQADILGTRMLVTSGYAADGLRNLMVTLKKEEEEFPISFLSSHPGASDRIGYLEKLIAQNGYNRYAYEGVARHAEIKAKVKQLLEEYKERKERKRR